MLDCTSEARATECAAPHVLRLTSNVTSSIQEQLLAGADDDVASLVAAADQLQHLEKLELCDLQVGSQPSHTYINMTQSIASHVEGGQAAVGLLIASDTFPAFR